jgi:hypothetical protein
MKPSVLARECRLRLAEPLKADCVFYMMRYASSFDHPLSIGKWKSALKNIVLYATTLGGNDTWLSILKCEVDSAE